jgi:hypothetical protein
MQGAQPGEQARGGVPVADVRGGDGGILTETEQGVFTRPRP